MYCPMCGNKLDQPTKFCPYCGTFLLRENEVSTPIEHSNDKVSLPDSENVVSEVPVTPAAPATPVAPAAPVAPAVPVVPKAPVTPGTPGAGFSNMPDNKAFVMSNGPQSPVIVRPGQLPFEEPKNTGRMCLPAYGPSLVYTTDSLQ